MTKSFDLVREAIKANGDSLFHCFLKLDRHIVKKNRRPIKRSWNPASRRRDGPAFIGKSDELLCAERDMTIYFRQAGIQAKLHRPLAVPLWAVFLFTFPAEDFVVKKGERKGKLSARMPDLSNLYELPQDCLQKAGVIENDNLICSHDLSRRLPGTDYSLEVFLFPYELEVVRPLKAIP